MPISVLRNTDKDEWKKLLNWTGRVGNDDSAYKPYRDRKPGERDLGDILDGSVAAVGNQEHGRRKYLVAPPTTVWFIFSKARQANILMI